MKKLFVLLVFIGIVWGIFLAIIETFAPLGIVLVIVGLVLLYKFRDRSDVKPKLYWLLGVGVVLCFGFFVDTSSEETSKETTKTTVNEEKKEDKEEITPKKEKEDVIKEDAIEEEKVKEETTEPVQEEKPVDQEDTPPAETTSIENKPQETPVEQVESFQNCTELRKVYPSGVPSSHSAYAPKHDRDNDNFACER